MVFVFAFYPPGDNIKQSFQCFHGDHVSLQHTCTHCLIVFLVFSFIGCVCARVRARAFAGFRDRLFHSSCQDAMPWFARRLVQV